MKAGLVRLFIAAFGAIAMLLAVQATAFAEVGTEGDGHVDAPAVYLHQATREPWGNEENDTAMDTAFGTNGWDEEHFETVDTGTGTGGLFAPGVKFIYLDGSDTGTNALITFLAANQSKLQAFVADGGRLFLDAAPNVGPSSFTYDGKTITRDNFSHDVVAVDPSNPIFNGPNTPAGTRYSGNSFGHAFITGSGLTPLIDRTVGDTPIGLPDPTAVVLASYRSGCGFTLIGGITTPNFHQPQPNGRNLRANILVYAATAANACPPPSAQTSAPSAVSTTSATLNGSVNPNGSGTTYFFEYGTSTSYGSQTPTQSAGSDSTTHPEATSISGLAAGTTYHYRIVATNPGGTTDGADMTFTTQGASISPGCIDRRHFGFVFHHDRGSRVIRVHVYVNGKLLLKKTGRSLKKLHLRRLPRGIYKVKIVTLATNGKQVISVRTYRPCNQTRPHMKYHRTR